MVLFFGFVFPVAPPPPPENLPADALDLQLTSLTLIIKMDSVKVGRQVRLFCPWARHLLTGLPSNFAWLDW